MSVRNPREALIAARYGADLIDIKDPARGPLGWPDPCVANLVARQVGTRRPVSIALGEVGETSLSSFASVLQLPGVRFAKLGLAGAGRTQLWWHRWEEAWRSVAPCVGRVGVIYVDWQAAHAPHPLQALQVMSDSSCSAILFDTFVKDGRTLLELVGMAELTHWIDKARRAAPLLVLAGSISIAILDRLLRLQPDYIGVRGGVCRGGRSGAVSGRRVRRLATALIHGATH